MQSVRITRQPAAPQQTCADITWQHPATRRPLVQPGPVPRSNLSPQLPRPRQGSPTRDPRPPTGQRRPLWSANTR